MLTPEIHRYWEREACGTDLTIVGDVPSLTLEWFERIETYRYDVEPVIHAVAQFTRHSGKKVLEVGVGAGTDHLQWARVGARCYGIDLTETAVKISKAHLALYNFGSNLQQANGERLPFCNDVFDVVYSWGVIHHAEYPAQVIQEIKRVLKTGGTFIGMLYGRHSIVVLKMWFKYALLKGRPWQNLKEVVWHHMESVGTQAYTVAELENLFSEFSIFSAKTFVSPYDTRRLPAWLSRFLPDDWGWFITVRAVK